MGGDPLGAGFRGVQGLQIGHGNRQTNIYVTVTGGSPQAPPLVSSSGSISFPYRGLNSFGELDAGLFFGRETATTQVLERISRLQQGTGALVVSGVSGAGKSSLLRAGVLPRLRGTGLAGVPEAAAWPCLLLTPGSDPLGELAVGIASMTGASPGALHRELADDPEGFGLTARSLAYAGRSADAAAQRRVLVIVDQCEELFTRCQDDDERRAFLTAMRAASLPGGRVHPPALVVLVIRADFEARLADYSLADAVRDRYLLTAMSMAELRLAITRPAVAAGASVDQELVQVLLESSGAGALPLLSHTLDQAWRDRRGQTLTLEDYVRSGGIEGAVKTSAERAYRKLTRTQRELARQVFIRLVVTDAQGTDSAARASRSGLLARADTRAHDVEAVLAAFAAERLLTLDAETVEISHEVLLTAWPRLSDDWLAGTHASRILLTGLENTAAAWTEADRDPCFLYSGSRLEAASALTQDPGSPVGPASRTADAFLGASRRAAKRRARRTRTALAALMALATGLAAAVVLVAGADDRATAAAAQSARELAAAISADLAGQALGDTDASAAQIQALMAYGLDGSSAEAYDAMLSSAANPQLATLPTGNLGFKSLLFSSSGQVLATIGGEGQAQLWNLNTLQPGSAAFPGSESSVPGAEAFSRDETMLAAVVNGSVQLWNVAAHRKIGGPFTSADGGVQSVTFSPDGKLIATVTGAGAVQLWSTATRSPLGTLFANDQTTSVTFSPDGETLATVADGVRLWHTATQTPIGGDFGRGDSATSVTFSRDGTIIATFDSVNASSPVRLWQTATGTQLGSAFADGEGVQSVAFSPDGELLATADADGSVRLWDTATRTVLGTALSAGIGPGTGFDSLAPSAVAFGQAGNTLAAGYPDGTVRLWNVTQITGEPMSSLFTGKPGSASVTFAPEGNLQATASNGEAVQLWHATTGEPDGGPLPGVQATGQVVFSPDGKLFAVILASGQVQLFTTATREPLGGPFAGGDDGVAAVMFGDDGTLVTVGQGDPFETGNDGPVRVWAVATRHQIGGPFGTADGGTAAAALDSSGSRLATVSLDGQIQLWNPRTHERVGAVFGTGGTGLLASIAFSADGTLLAECDLLDGVVRLWNVATHRQVGSPLASGTGGIITMAFSPEGPILATVDKTGAVRFWDVDTGQQIGSALAGADFGPMSFSPDGTTLATISRDGKVTQWDTSYLTDPRARICAQIGGSLTPADWSQYVPAGLAYRNFCRLVAQGRSCV